MHLPNQLFHHANETSPASLRTPNWHGSVGSDLDEGTHEFHTEDERAKLGVTLRAAESPQTAAWTPSPPLIYTKLSLLHCAGGIPSFLSQLFSAPLHKSPKGHLNSRAADARVTQRSIVYCSRHAQNINICAQGAACFYYNFFLVRSDCTGRAFFLYLYVSLHDSNVMLIWNGSNVNIQIELTSDCFAYERFTHSLHHAGWRVQHRHSLDSLYFAFCRRSRTCLVCRVPGGFLFKRLSFRPRLEESSLILLMYDDLILAILTWFL